MILDRQTIGKWIEKSSVILWFFVIGIGVGIILYSYVNFNFEKYQYLFLTTIAGLTILSLFLPKSFQLFPNFTCRKFVLIFASFCFGIFWYFNSTKITSPTHLLSEENGRYKFIDTDISEVSIVYGTIVGDPDIREDATNIIVKPHIIIPHPDKYTIEVDTTNKKVIIEKEYVKRIIDGDTFETVSGEKIRLAGVNAPEINTLEGQRAKEFLEKILLNKEISLLIQEDFMFDIYDRILAVVFVDNINVNKLLLEEGFAEFYDDPNIKIIKKQLYGKPIHLQGDTGLIRAKVLPTIGDYYFQMSYGDYVKIVSPIMLPRKATNPAGFDYRKYLNARGIYAVTKTLRNPADIRYEGVGNVSKIIRFAFVLRKKILLTIRKTIPYPQSAFLGGVTLGYRGGVPQKIREQFQATGVAHVLALSGLHTGFIAALLLILCNIFKVKALLRFIVISISLTIFVIMTGAYPATIRAALMFST
ncbi:MAG: ComEC/Rec2 family competence protein, partial [Endomicrobia bacterium]|nr:ComEC/Rec2 family competence protein [Endomicrobiia bacterium]